MEQQGKKSENREKREWASPEEPQVLADFFRTFSDPTRLRVLSVLAEGEICVSDLAERLGMNQSAISHQLKVLKAGRLVRTRREGKQIFYSPDDEHVEGILDAGIEHIREL